MTRKSLAKPQRTRTATKATSRAPATRERAAGRNTVVPSVVFRSAKEAADFLRTRPVLHVADDVAGMESPVSRAPVVKKECPSARCAIVAAAFHAATSGAVRRKLKCKSALALVVLVPGARAGFSQSGNCLLRGSATNGRRSQPRP